ncbi:MAG: acyltransferase 3 [Acidimicrobiales bacterium]|nr:acyltransferase 3 [Acidimicrobiales bacterium]
MSAMGETTEDVVVAHGDQGRFAALNGLRLLSAAAIVFFHAAGAGGTNLAATTGAGQLFVLLSVGVPIFFVLSGFLLYRPMVATRLTGGPARPVGRYAWHRFRRVLPAYWVVLFLAVHLEQATVGQGTDTWRFAFLLQIYEPDLFFGGLIVAWSLCTEASFYVYLPVHNLMMRLSKGRPAKRILDEWVACGVLFAISIAFKVWYHQGDHVIGNGTLPAYLDAFAVGMALAVFSVAESHRRRPGRLFRLVARCGGWTWVAAAAVFFVASRHHYPTGLQPVSIGEVLGRHGAYVLIAFLLLVPLVVDRQATTPLGAFLASPVMRWWGELSYGIFLIHLPLVEWLQLHWMDEPPELLPTLWLGVVTLAASSALAAVLYAVVEWPLRHLELGRKGGRRRTDAPDPDTALGVGHDIGAPATLRSGADG